MLPLVKLHLINEFFSHPNLSAQESLIYFMHVCWVLPMCQALYKMITTWWWVRYMWFCRQAITKEGREGKDSVLQKHKRGTSNLDFGKPDVSTAIVLSSQISSLPFLWVCPTCSWLQVWDFYPVYSGHINSLRFILCVKFLPKRFLVEMVCKLTLFGPHPVPGLQTHRHARQKHFKRNPNTNGPVPKQNKSRTGRYKNN